MRLGPYKDGAQLSQMSWLDWCDSEEEEDLKVWWPNGHSLLLPPMVSSFSVSTGIVRVPSEAT